MPLFIRVHSCDSRALDGNGVHEVRPLLRSDFFVVARCSAPDLTDGNREEASRMLEICERTLYRKIKEYELRK